MISPELLTITSANHAGANSLFMPRHENEFHFLVVGNAGELKAIDVSKGQHRFSAVDAIGASAWTGVMIQNVSFEVDLESVVDAYYATAPIGTLVRRENSLSILTQYDRSTPYPVPLQSNLPLCEPHQGAAFKRWQIVIGSGDAKQVLLKISID